MSTPLKPTHKQPDLVATLDQCSQSLPTVFSGTNVTFPYNGSALDVPTIAGKLSDISTQLKSVTQAKTAWLKQEAAAAPLRILARLLLAVIQGVARNWFGATSAQVTQLGLKAAKVRAAPTRNLGLEARRSVADQQIADAEATAKATRANKTGSGIVNFGTGAVTPLPAPTPPAVAPAATNGSSPAPAPAATPEPASQGSTAPKS